MAATISSIPEANTAFLQMDALNQAVAALNTGSTVTNLTVSAPPAPPEDPTKFTLPITVTLNPPISDSATIAALIAALHAQEQAICDALVAAGYIDDLDAARARAIGTAAAPPTFVPPAAPMPPMTATPYAVNVTPPPYTRRPEDRPIERPNLEEDMANQP